MLDEIKNNMDRDRELSEFACKNSDCIRFREEDADFRPPYLRDADRIIYSLAYTRYIDKTQVFSEVDNDNISKRMTHVQMVSKIARTIGRALKLNEDLIEAASLGHDIGHAPFGHAGEAILNKISLENNEGYFNHNIESVRELVVLDNNGLGHNLSLQVLDAIMCHNGELELIKYKPVKKTKEQFLEEYYNSYKDSTQNSKLIPMTLEGCVVRISDIIAYLGRDIEDAISLNLLNKKDLPDTITLILGNSNSSIINTLVNDVIKESYNKDYIRMSEVCFRALKELKKFNYENIYSKASTKENMEKWEKMFRLVFNYYLKALEENNKDTNIYKIYLNNMNEEYLNKTSNARKVIDYIAGMTDDFIVNEYNLLTQK